ncbi:MAG: hypothetical protein PHV75_08290 [Victivallaceae bacterium]|nr:hypothetical protein [Victivallaceae bacterium]MDD3117022.1 hypothetical protein [Victivallaceae bacterium]MDD4318501.1 hypothetical protein [Victivallaceae bacterium]
MSMYRMITEIKIKTFEEHRHFLSEVSKLMFYFSWGWHSRLCEPYQDIGGNFGFWGKIFNARCVLNQRAAEFVRHNFDIEYRPGRSQCSFRNMREHLKKLLEQ